MDTIRDKYTNDAAAARAAIPDRFLKLDQLLAANSPDVAALQTQVIHARSPKKTAHHTFLEPFR